MICLVDGSKVGLSDLDPKRAVKVGKRNLGKGFFELRRVRQEEGENENPPPMAKPKRPVAPLPPPMLAHVPSGSPPAFNLGEAFKRAKAFHPTGNEQVPPKRNC